MSRPATIDQKGRLKIPVDLLATLTKSGAEFYVTSESGDSVRIYPMPVWNRFDERLARLCLRNSNYQKFLARAKYFGEPVAPDKQGRVLIPIALRRSAQIKGSVDVLDYLSYLEVWNHSRFLKTLRSNPITPQDENVLNEQLSSVARFPLSAPRKKNKEQMRGKTGKFHLRRRMPRHSHGHSIRAIREVRSDASQSARVA